MSDQVFTVPHKQDGETCSLGSWTCYDRSELGFPVKASFAVMS